MARIPDDDEAVLEEVMQANEPPLHREPEGSEEQEKPEPDEVEAKAEPDEGEGEQQEQGEEGEQDRDDKGKFVPHAKFNSEYQRRKEAELRASTAEQRMDKLMQMLEQRQQPSQEQRQPEEPKEQMPGEDDLVGRLQWVVNKVQEGEKRQNETQQEYRRRQESENLGRQVVEAAKQEFKEATEADPTVTDAYRYMADSRVREIMSTQGLPQEQAVRAFHQEEIELYYNALQRRQRPSAVVRQIAESRGWRPQAQEQTTEDPAKDIEAKEERRRAHTSLSSAAGSEAPKKMTGKDLAKMDEDEFADFMRKFPGEVDRLMKAG